MPVSPVPSPTPDTDSDSPSKDVATLSSSLPQSGVKPSKKRRREESTSLEDVIRREIYLALHAQTKEKHVNDNNDDDRVAKTESVSDKQRRQKKAVYRAKNANEIPPTNANPTAINYKKNHRDSAPLSGLTFKQRKQLVGCTKQLQKLVDKINGLTAVTADPHANNA